MVHRHIFAASIVCLLSLQVLANVASAGDPVSFDVPAIAIAQRVNPDVVKHPTAGGKLIRIRLPISTYIGGRSGHGVNGASAVEQYVVRLTSPYLSMRVIDFWPKTETYNDLDGAVSVKTSVEDQKQIGGKGGVEYPAVGQASLESSLKRTTKREETYQQKPPMEVLSSSGTIHRGYGVFFKFLAGPHVVLEGAREVAVLVEVPAEWRADMIHVSMQALGRQSSRSGLKQLGSEQLWTAVYQEGDMAAAAQASSYVTDERRLRVLAAASQEAVSKRSLPSVWHKLGAALDVVDPKIPSDYLTNVIFSSRNIYRDNSTTNRLPVDLRVAILDYWDERERLVSLSMRGVPSQSVSAATGARAVQKLVSKN